MANELSGVSLEAIVDEEIRPLMKAWLDKNLATVVEASVRETIARLSAPEGG
jgi:cell pole-organizing protein PopZ